MTTDADTRVNLPMAETELCDRYEQLFTPAVNDVLREFGLLHQVLPPAILPLRPKMRVAGIAFTVKGAKSLLVENEMVERAKMLDQIHGDAVCVWDTSDDDESAQWGEVMTLAAQQRGCRGAIVDGGIRDTAKILALDFPVFCRYRTSNGMLGRFRMTAWQVPVRIAHVTIEPGDVIFGDADGVIVVPRRLAYRVLLAAEEINTKEVEIKQAVADGASPQEVVDRGGYF